METKKENNGLQERTTGNPFRIPEGYFDRLPQRIMDQVGSENVFRRETFLTRFIRPSLGIAAGLIVILVLIFFPYRMFKSDRTTLNASALIDEEYYLSYSMDDQKIYETLENENPETPFDNKELENVLLVSVNEYELIVLNN